jgi:hypothetical protein
VNLAIALKKLHTLRGQPEDATKAARAFRMSIKMALEQAPEIAIRAANSFGDWAASRRAFSEAAEAYGYGLEAVEQLFRTQLTRAHKESWLRDAQGGRQPTDPTRRPSRAPAQEPA